MKERVSFTFDLETIKVIDKVLEDKNYRNKSHFVERAILSFGREELGEENE